ncbi:inheritance of peroxisomes protein 1-domain-containing protein [Cercophora newfieldiana]|uniref:Inheritance of peroxisomes protein 1 n=1 Tax=Cercophora newfieldiana TaxID=92897 RepID=A0AA39Y9Y8_9PEZI|nr:inheritance of peroxisomes protein 1-domain-containing protein [Cercophora newfieldiana]
MEFSRPRRVFTAPTQSTSQHASSSRTADGSVDILYDHPSVKIVAFTAGPRSFTIGPRPGVAQDIEPGTLSWSSQLERTIAAGPFRIYRAPGSVAFLSCGSALQPILPKSQVWCVDEASSKFVLQIRRPQYWRIEIPVGNVEDDGRAQLLREVFDKILQFEKTECPFKRTFTVDLPEPSSTPIKKRPWTPVRKPSVSLPPTPITPSDAREKRAEGPSVHSSTERDEPTAVELEPVSPTLEQGCDTVTEKPEEDENASPVVQAPMRPNVADLRGFYSSRCVTAPPHLMLDSIPKSPEVIDALAEDPKLSSPESRDSFHTPQSFLSSPPLPPSPPQSIPPSPVASPSPHQCDDHDKASREDQSDITAVSGLSQEPWAVSPTTAPSESSECATALSSVCDTDCPLTYDELATPECDEPTPAEEPTTPSETHPLKPSISNASLSSDLSLSSSLSRSSSASTTRRSNIRHRATTSSSISPSRRALSPLPSAVNLFSPRPLKRINQKNTLAVIGRLPMAVIQKTCEILMSPPSHLINLMLKVAARITAGEWRGLVFGVDERGEQIPVQWDWSEEEDNATHGHVDGRRFSTIDEEWPPRINGRRMAGSFPESDDEFDGEKEEKEEDWDVGVD